MGPECCAWAYGIYEKIFLSETTGHSALIFGTCNHLIDLYRVYSNYAPQAKKSPAKGVMDAYTGKI